MRSRSRSSAWKMVALPLVCQERALRAPLKWAALTNALHSAFVAVVILEDFVTRLKIHTMMTKMMIWMKLMIMIQTWRNVPMIIWPQRIYVSSKQFKARMSAAPSCVKSTHIGSLFCLTSQSIGINRMRTHASKVYFAISFNGLRCQIAEKWATQF